MTFRNLTDDICTVHSHHPSLEDQVAVLAIHYWVGSRPKGPYLKKSEMDDVLDELGIDLDTTLDTAASNLREAGYIDGFQPNDQPDWWIIRQRDGEFVMGDDHDPAVRKERERAINHIQSMDPSPDADDSPVVADGGDSPVLNDDGDTLREVVADEFGIDPGKLENHLRSGGHRAQRERLNTIVDVVEESDTFSKPDTYDKIEFIPTALRYHLTEKTIRDYNLY